jgi:hypothetical protein
MNEPDWKAEAAHWEGTYMRLPADYHRLEVAGPQHARAPGHHPARRSHEPPRQRWRGRGGPMTYLKFQPTERGTLEEQ